MNTVLTITGVYNGNDIASWTEYQKTLHTAKQEEPLDIDKFRVVEVVDRPESPQVHSTRWVHKQWLDGSYKCELTQEDSRRLSVMMQIAKAHDLSRSSHHCCDPRKSSSFRRLSQCVSSLTNAERIRTSECRDSI